MNLGLYRNNVLRFDEDDEEERPAKRPRIFRPRINFDRDDIDTRQRFRLTQAHVQLLVERIGPYIDHGSNKNHALSAEQQIMLSLR
jgi:hypothetical protein